MQTSPARSSAIRTSPVRTSHTRPSLARTSPMQSGHRMRRFLQAGSETLTRAGAADAATRRGHISARHTHGPTPADLRICCDGHPRRLPGHHRPHSPPHGNDRTTATSPAILRSGPMAGPAAPGAAHGESAPIWHTRAGNEPAGSNFARRAKALSHRVRRVTSWRPRPNGPVAAPLVDSARIVWLGMSRRSRVSWRLQPDCRAAWQKLMAFRTACWCSWLDACNPDRQVAHTRSRLVSALAADAPLRGSGPGHWPASARPARAGR
jgi:hypothetical protein